ncbi:MAG: hypothetical protein ACXAEF_04340 [Candidatus Thorarchaeota archaeon]|jgi:hypothetical protein
MAEEEKDQVYVFCNLCKENVPLEVTESELDTSSGLTTVISVHGSPQHAILVYLDKQMKARGIEYPSVLQVKDSPMVESATEMPKEEVLYDLSSVVSSFGEKQDDAVRSFAQITAQVIVRNHIYLIHANREIGKVVKNQLDALFTDQETSVAVISYDEMDGVSGMRPTIFDLQHGTFVSKGVAIDTEVFESFVGGAIKDVNGFNLLKNEFSKLMYSYRRLWELLSAGARKYTRKRLAYLVSIDQSLMPLLLQMAENDGVDVASRVRLTKEEERKSAR